MKAHKKLQHNYLNDENAMEIENKTQYNVKKMKHAIIAQRYKYPDDIYTI